MELTNYFDFAENDYEYFMWSYENGRIANAMAADAQEICEKYMKHLIDVYDDPQTIDRVHEQTSVLRTHNLGKLMDYIEKHVFCRYSENTELELRAINGYYFTARYPGDESVTIKKSDLDLCARAVKSCREETLELIQTLEKRGLEEEGEQNNIDGLFSDTAAEIEIEDKDHEL